MQRAITAIYPSADLAELVRRDLEQLGIGGHDITILPDLGGSTGFSGDAMDRLRNLGLPDTDARTYQQAIQNGDYVVSVEVDDDDNLSRVQEIMRRPEDAYDLDELDTRYADADYVPTQQAAYADTGSMSQAGGMGTTGLGTGLGMGAAAAGLSQTGGYRNDELNDDGTVKVVEERLNFGKRDVDMGSGRVGS